MHTAYLTLKKKKKKNIACPAYLMQNKKLFPMTTPYLVLSTMEVTNNKLPLSNQCTLNQNTNKLNYKPKTVIIMINITPYKLMIVMTHLNILL